MSFLWHDDPLAGLPEIAPYPGQPESSSSSGLSSLPGSPIVQQNDTEVINNILDEYQEIHANDDTAKVLRAFADNLSGQGLSTLQSEIYSFSTNPQQLRQLRNFLVDALLKPSMLTSYEATYPILTLHCSGYCWWQTPPSHTFAQRVGNARNRIGQDPN